MGTCEDTAESLMNSDLLALVGHKQFALDFYKTISQKKQNEDIFFSPLGIHTVLSMVYLGSDKDTKVALSKTLHVLDPIQTAEEYSKIIEELSSVKNITLCIANKVFLKNQYMFQKEFGSTVEKKFQSEVDNSLNFGQDSKGAAKAINSWVDKKTSGKIPTLFEPDDFDEDTRLVLVNAIYFKGNWENQFDKADTRTEPFYFNGEDNKIDVQMMHITSTFGYAVDEQLQAQIVELPFKEHEVTMTIVLPLDINGIENLGNKVVELSIDTIISQVTASSCTVDLALPKFKLSADINLKDILIKMGIGVLFDSQSCNLQNMIDASEQFYVSKATQKAFMEVNEEGAEAAVVTEVTADEYRSARKTTHHIFYADHPFLVILRRKHGILFYGKIIKPVSEDEEAPRSEPDRANRSLGKKKRFRDWDVE